MAGIITSIEDMASDPSVSVESVLLRVLVLARRLQHQRLTEWATSEIEGYHQEVPVPDYRQSASSLAIKAVMTNGFRRDVIVVPYEIFPDETLYKITRPDFREPIESYAHIDRSQQYQIPEGELTRKYVEAYVSGFQCELVYREVPAGILARVASTVRSRTLAYVAELRRQFPELDLDQYPRETPPTAFLDRTLNVTILAGAGPIHFGSGSITQLNTRIVKPGDLQSLLDYLSDLKGSLTSEDIEELQGIIETHASAQDLEDESSRLRRWIDGAGRKVASAAGPLAGKAAGEAIILAVRQFYDQLPDLF